MPIAVITLKKRYKLSLKDPAAMLEVSDFLDNLAEQSDSSGSFALRNQALIYSAKLKKRLSLMADIETIHSH